MTAALTRTTTTVLDVDPAVICASPFNHRKVFKGIDELGASLLEKGMISPVTVRPKPADALTRKYTYELVVGERRWRGAKLVKLPTMPVIVRDLTDKEVIEIQLVENVQRADVHPIEEAEGYEELIERHGYDVDMVAAKIGKSKAYVYARLKLTSLAAGPRAAFLEDRLVASIALLIARIPDEQLQERATKEILGEATFDELERVGINIDDPEDPASFDRRGLAVTEGDDLVSGEAVGDHRLHKTEARERIPMSVREAQVHLRRRYMLRLDDAKFDTADATLVAKAGACTTCVYRTGNQRELFGEVANADVCTNPPCFEAKTLATWDIAAADALAQGQKVIEQVDAKRIFETGDDRIARSSPYVDPKAEVPYDLLPAGTQKRPTWEKLLGAKLEAPTVLVQDGTGAPRELLDKRAAVEVLREHGKIDKPLKPAGSSGGGGGGGAVPDWQKDQERRAKQRDLRERTFARLRRDFITAANKQLDAKKELPMWRWICAALLAHTELDDDVVEWLGVKKQDSLLAKIDTAAKARTLIAILMFARETESTWGDLEKNAIVLAGLKLFALDYDDALAEAKKAQKEADKAEAAIAANKTGASDDGKPAKKKAGKK